MAGATISAAQRSASQQPASTSSSRSCSPPLCSTQGFSSSIFWLCARTRRQVASSAPEGRNDSQAAWVAASNSGAVLFEIARAASIGADVAVHHRERPVQEVPEVVSQIRLVTLEQRLVGEVAVAAQGVLAQDEVAKWIDPPSPSAIAFGSTRVAGIDFEIFWPFTVK